MVRVNAKVNESGQYLWKWSEHPQMAGEVRVIHVDGSGSKAINRSGRSI